MDSLQFYTMKLRGEKVDQLIKAERFRLSQVMGVPVVCLPAPIFCAWLAYRANKMVRPSYLYFSGNPPKPGNICAIPETQWRGYRSVYSKCPWETM